MALSFTSFSWLSATQTENFGLHAVPVPGPLMIDGGLEDWDTSGEALMCYDLETLQDTYSARVSTMYDAQNLYVAIKWKDTTPLGNIHDPRYRADKAWAGDSVQLRIKTDRITHITAWYYAEGKEPAMLVDYGVGVEKPFGGDKRKLLGVGGAKLQEGVEMAFKEDDDRKGYVQEIKIPWRLITTEKKFSAGDTFQLGIELLWGEADWPAHRYADNMTEGTSSREFFFVAHKNWGNVTLEAKGGLKLPEPAYMQAFRKAQEGEKSQGPVEIAYDLPKDARVTLAIDDKGGSRVRNLIPARPRKAGKNVEHWDGMDDSGKPVSPGEYAFKIIYHDGIHASYALSFANPGDPTWKTDDGRGAFYADHTAPTAAAAAGGFVVLAAPMAEAGQQMIGLNLEGQKLWGLPNRNTFDGGWVSLATDGKILWVAEEGKASSVYRVNVATGKYAPWNAIEKTESGQELALLDLKVSELPGVGTKERPSANLRAIAWHDGTVAICLHREGIVKILDADTGAQRAAFPVPEPQGIAHDGKSWLVLSQGKIQRLGEEGKLTRFAGETFAEAYGLAAGADGKIYLSVRGTEHRVKVFSPTGKLIREIGQRGGRPHHGPFQPGGMRNPAGIAVDSRDRLWVTETTKNPKRTSQWDVRTGELLRDFSGTTSYAGAGSLNPFDSTMGFADDTVYHIDWEKRTYKPLYSIGKSDRPDALFHPSVHNLTSRIIEKNGRTYVFTTGSAMGSGETQVTMFDGKNWRVVAQIGTVQQGTLAKNEAARKVYLTGEWAKYQHPFFSGHDHETYAWADLNDDGVVQQNELQFAPLNVDGKPMSLRSCYWGQLPGTDGALTYYVRELLNGQASASLLLQYTISGYTPSGVPRYDVANPRMIRVSQPLLDAGEGQVVGGSDGRIYLNQSPLVAIHADGKVLGQYPSRNVSVHGSHKATAAKPGYIIGPSSILGVAPVGDGKLDSAGEVFYLNGNLGENYLFTYDTLYIQTLFKDTRGSFENPGRATPGMPMDGITAGGESFGGNFTRMPDGKYYVTLGATDARVMEITGLDSIRRLSGKFSYSSEQYAEAQKQAAARAQEANKPKSYRIAKAVVPVEMDGKASEWPELLAKETAVVEIQENPRKRFGRVQLRYDAENLYAAWLAMAPRNEWKNSGQDFRLLFKTGDAVDLMLGPEEQKPDGEGNLRLLFASLGGNPAAVLNQKTVRAAAASEGFDFASPWRTIHFQRVVLAPEVKVATGRIAGGYFVETAVPWKLLGVQPKSGLKLKGDVGVLYGDAGGRETIARHYWSNQNTNLVNDIPGEAELAPKLWGTFELE